MYVGKEFLINFEKMRTAKFNIKNSKLILINNNKYYKYMKMSTWFLFKHFDIFIY